MKRTWNVRVIKYDHLKPEDGEYYHAIHEVHYDGYKILAWTVDAMDIGGMGLDETRRYYDLLGKAFSAPVLSMVELRKAVEGERETP